MPHPTNTSKKYKVILFQPYIRQFVLNLGHKLKQFEFQVVASGSGRASAASANNFTAEVSRRKLKPFNRLRRLIGLPNIRLRLSGDGDLFFTYGCLLITNKPYCVYVETGLTLFNYDVGIVKNPIARFLVYFLATRSNCKKLIFISHTAQKSFLASTNYSNRVRHCLERKSVVIYPMPITRKGTKVKKFHKKLKLLFPGQFYFKGGAEIANAYAKLCRKYPNINLTIITTLQMLRPKDLAFLKSLPNLTLLEAKLTEAQMIEIYSSHDVFLLPTYREGFGLVLIEALAYGLPIIATDQYATTEMVRDHYNGFVYPNHPLKDYDPNTHAMLGKYYNPADFYSDLFRFQKSGKMKPIEDFLVSSISQFLDHPQLLERYSRHSFALYKEKFSISKISDQIERVFLDAVTK